MYNLQIRKVTINLKNLFDFDTLQVLMFLLKKSIKYSNFFDQNKAWSGSIIYKRILESRSGRLLEDKLYVYSVVNLFLVLLKRNSCAHQIVNIHNYYKSIVQLISRFTRNWIYFNLAVNNTSLYLS